MFKNNNHVEYYIIMIDYFINNDRVIVVFLVNTTIQWCSERVVISYEYFMRVTYINNNTSIR